MTQGTAFNMNGANPSIASSNTGTASIFNANIATINLGQAASISMGSTSGTVTARGNLTVNGNTTLGDAAADTITANADTATVPNTLTFTIDDAIATNVSYPVKVRHTTSGTAATGMGTGIQFITETAGGVNRAGVNIEAIATTATNGAENFNFVVDTMTAGGTAAQALSVNNNTLTVGATSTATTITTQSGSSLTILPGATGVTSNGTSLTLKAGQGGTTSGNGGAATIGAGDASTSGVGGIATFRSGVSVGTNQVGVNTVIESGNGTGTGGSGDIVFRTAQPGVSGSTANTMADRFYIRPSGAIDVVGTLTIGGDLIVNGLTTTINSNTVSVDDKNIELGSIVAKTGLQATLSTGTAVVTLTAGTTIGLIPGMSLTVTGGTGAFGASALVTSIQSTSQFTATVNHATAGAVTFTANGASDFTADGGGITLLGATNKTISWSRVNDRWDSSHAIAAPRFISTVASGTAPLTVASNTVVTNLNADLLDGFNSAQASTVSTVAVRDSFGDIVVRLVRSEFANETTLSGAMAFRVNNTTDNYVRFCSDTAAIRAFLDVPTRTGGNASGTWSINVTGNAGTATTLQTARSIGGVSFNGSADINLPGVNIGGNQNTTGNAATATTLQTARNINGTSFNGSANITTASWGTSRTITIGSTGKAVDGGSAVSWSLAEIGAPATDGTGASGTWSINVTGNAGTATTLQTARTINGTSFNGGANIVIDQLFRIDDRTITPADITAGYMKFGFTSWNNNNGTPYADFLHMRSYTDSSGGNDNLVMFRKDAIGMRVYQQAWGSSSAYSTFKDVVFTDGTGASGTWGISITGNAATATSASTAVNLSTVRSNWSTNGTISAVVGQLAWKNYGNSHTIFDASAGTSPDGGAVNNTNAAVAWSGSYPTLMGWNGASTYGVRVDSARISDSTSGNAATVTDGMYLSPTQTVTGTKYFQSNLGATSGSLSSPPLQVYATGGNSAFMSFHRSGAYAVNMGLDSDNVLRIGGWSASANRLQLDMSGNLTLAGGVFTTVLSTGATATGGSVTGQWTLGAGSTWQATFADLAEYYNSDEEYEPGTVLVYGGESELTQSTIYNDRKIAGVVSTHPAYIMNAGCEGTRVCMALQGRVPVKVIGRVEKGDMLVSSNVAGHAVVNNEPAYGSVIGKAIETKDTEEAGLILVSINI